MLVGLPGYVTTFLKNKADVIVANVATACANMYPREATAPKVLGRQCLWVTNLQCLQYLGNYWARHLPPHVTTLFCCTIDQAVDSAFLLATDIDMPADSLATLHRI